MTRILSNALQDRVLKVVQDFHATYHYGPDAFDLAARLPKCHGDPLKSGYGDTLKPNYAGSLLRTLEQAGRLAKVDGGFVLANGHGGNGKDGEDG